MSVRDAILSIDRAVEQSLGDREPYESKQDEGRRDVYEQAIERVSEVGGTDKAEHLTTWIEGEIRDEGRLPDEDEVQQKAAEFCSESDSSVSADDIFEER